MNVVRFVIQGSGSYADDAAGEGVSEMVLERLMCRGISAILLYRQLVDHFSSRITALGRF